MKWRTASLEDAPLLGELNLQLIQDEKHRDPMTLALLVQRMRDFLGGDYQAVVFEHGGEVVGYALFHFQEDFLYLRQFFIVRHRRRQGMGRAAVQLLRDEVFPADRRLVVTVLTTNPEALQFWRAVGFADYCISLEILPRSVTERGATAQRHPSRQLGRVGSA